MLRSLLCILLLCASSTVLARDIRMQSANGEEGTCPSADAEANDDAKPVSNSPATHAKRVKQPATVRGSDNSRTHGPRWHSFLPGMFR
ncbi:MAG: hypothetical protein ABIO38_03175 [Luteimonas sp.]